MNKLAEYALLFGAIVNDDWVEKRRKAVADILQWIAKFSAQDAIRHASDLANAMGNVEKLPSATSALIAGKIQEHAVSFVASSESDELQIKVLLAVAVMDLFDQELPTSQSEVADLLAAALWSALSYQLPIEETKSENVRRDLLEACRARALSAADAGRERTQVPAIGVVTISQDSPAGLKVNQAFRKAVEPMVVALESNAELDREELDFMWWLLANHSDSLDVPLAALPSPTRALASGIDAANRLKKLPGHGHRHIVLRDVLDGEPIALPELLAAITDHRENLAAALPPPAQAPAVFPLLYAIANCSSEAEFSSQRRSLADWGARALLEGSVARLATLHVTQK